MSKSFFDYFPAPQFLDMPFAGLDISPKAVRVIELKKEGSAFKLSRFGERILKTTLSGTDTLAGNEELKKALQSMKRQFKLGFIKATLPEDEAYLFKTSIEPGTDDEIRTAIEFHLEENVPLSGEEAVFDFHKFNGPTGLEAVVTVLPKRIIEAYLDLFAQCELTPLSFILEPTATSRALIKKGDMNAYLTVNLGEVKTSLAIVSDGAVQFASTVQLGSDNFNAAIAKQYNVADEEAKKIKEEKGMIGQADDSDLYAALANTTSILKDEIERVYVYWHSRKDKDGHQGKKIEKLILVGRDSMMAGFKDHLALSLRIPVEIGNVWTNTFSLDKVIPAINQADSLNYAAAIGAVLPKGY